MQPSLAPKAPSRSRQRPSATAADRRFSRYGPEKEKAVRDAEVHEGTFGQIRDAWNNWKKSAENSLNYGPISRTNEDAAYDGAILGLEGINVSAKDVEKFCVLLMDHQDEYRFSEKAGLFLSALINSSSERDFTIQTKHLHLMILNLGYRNTKNIVVEGNLGGGIGERMKQGSIVVKGDCGDNIGLLMEGGIITVEGSSSGCDGIGYRMKGGRIIIKGHVHGEVANDMQSGIIEIVGDVTGRDLGEFNRGIIAHVMTGGEIHLHGRYHSLGKVKGGTIFHQGVQIYPKPEGAN